MLRCRCVAVRGGVAGDVRDERKEMHLIMVRWIKGIVAVAALVFTNEVAAQETLPCGIWRRRRYSKQLHVAGTAGGRCQFPALPLSFSVRGVLHRCTGVHRFCSRLLPGDGPDACLQGRSGRLSLADIYCVSPAGEKRDSYGYFSFGKGSPHRIEAGIRWRISEQVPVTLAWYTTLFGGSDYNAAGKRVFASYFEISYPFTLQGHRPGGGYRHGAVECLRRLRYRPRLLCAGCPLQCRAKLAFRGACRTGIRYLYLRKLEPCSGRCQFHGRSLFPYVISGRSLAAAADSRMAVFRNDIRKEKNKGCLLAGRCRSACGSQTGCRGFLSGSVSDVP